MVAFPFIFGGLIGFLMSKHKEIFGLGGDVEIKERYSLYEIWLEADGVQESHMIDLNYDEVYYLFYELEMDDLPAEYSDLNDVKLLIYKRDSEYIYLGNEPVGECPLDDTFCRERFWQKVYSYEPEFIESKYVEK